MPASRALVVRRSALAERAERVIRTIRGHRVILDADIAALYGVEVRALVQAMKRNRTRFPDDFVFRLTAEEARILRSQTVISSWGGRRTLPYAFTQEGAAMLSSVLRSRRAVETNIAIMRAFIRTREVLAGHEVLAGRIDALKTWVRRQFRRRDRALRAIVQAIDALMAPPARPPKRIGF